MKDYLIKIKLRSGTGTPWHSDTIFGHLCWQVVFGALDMRIEEFLRPFKEGKPPFVLSEGFPEGLMPIPLIKTKRPEASDRQAYRQMKKQKKSPYCSLDDFLKICRGETNSVQPIESPWRNVVVPHASLDRNKFSTGEKGEGGFYETESTYLDSHPPHSNAIIDIYLRCEPEWADKVRPLFEIAAKSGYGRDKTIGLGAMDFVSVEPFAKFGEINNPNGFVSLSSMTPAADDPIDARIKIRTKYGKLGEGIQTNPFKRPLIQIEPGAVFNTGSKPKEFYGRIVENIAPGNPEAIQNCYTLAVPCVIP
jgi:CRISPR-associated protein Csm4